MDDEFYHQDMMPAGLNKVKPSAKHKIQFGKTKIKLMALRATFQLDASREAIRDLLTDYDRFRETFKRIHSLEILNEDDRGARVRFKIKVLFLSFDYTLQRDYERPHELLTWHRTAGDFRQISGSWEIIPGPDAGIQVVIFESFVDAGYLIPTAMVRDRAARELETTVTHIRARLEGLQQRSTGLVSCECGT